MGSTDRFNHPDNPYEKERARWLGETRGALDPGFTTTPAPYSETTACLKCGATGASTKWLCERNVYYDQAYGGSRVRVWNERLERVCQRCGYLWHEKPLNEEKT